MKQLKNVLVLPPLGYLDFLMLMRKCEVIITDSGGIQEEATAPASENPCLSCAYQLRDLKLLKQVLPKLLEQRRRKFLAALNKLDDWEELPCVSPFGDGNAAKKTY